MVDWTVARAVSRLAANAGSAPELGEANFAGLAGESEQHLVAYTGLAPNVAIPAPEAVDRAEWAQVNVDSLSKLLGPVAERLGARFDKAGPFAPALKLASGAAVAAEVGLVIGYMSQRVLGQYELSLLEPELPARLLFVAPNLARALDEQKVDRESFLGWIVLHELTHVLQFSGVPWLREYVGSLLREYLATVEVRMERGGFGGLSSLPNPSALLESFREGGIVALVQTQEQRLIMDRLQSVMSVIEGYSEHVMDAVGAEVLPAYEGLRDAMQRRRRNRSAPERVLQRLLGLELKMRQYELGKQFCDAVVAEHGIAALNQVWDGPEAIPSSSELLAPSQWIARLDAGRAAA